MLYFCRFLEDCYLCYDPFAPRRRPLLLGSRCAACSAMVCAADTCSFFYSKRFCAPCAWRNRKAFPPECYQLAPKIFTAGTPAGGNTAS